MYKCNNFTLEELLPKTLFRDLEEQNKLQIGWLLFDERLLKTLDLIRDCFGPVTVNDWKWGGTNQYRGFRPAVCHIGSKYSQHKYGRACDCIFKNHTADDVRSKIIASPDDFPLIRGIEMGVSWLHFDVRNSEELILF